MVRRMAGVIEIEGLRKEYRRLRGGRTIAVDGLDLEVPEGGVFGRSQRPHRVTADVAHHAA